MKRVIVTAGVLASVVVGCATNGPQPSAAVTTLIPGAERRFRLDWTADPERDGARRLRGHIESTLGEPANRIQLLALALDPLGNVVGRRLEWLPETVSPGDRVYFEIAKMPPAADYRVTVWSYDRLKGGM
jgi:hypothetical protein